MASNTRQRSQNHRRARRGRSTSIVDVDTDVSNEPACIDLTLETSGEDVIDLTSSRGFGTFGLIDSPIVVLSPADNVGPVRRRRGSGRLGRRRSNSGRPRTGSRRSHLEMVDDSDEELPEIPFPLPPLEDPAPSGSGNHSLLASPEGVKITCPVCMDDCGKISRDGRRLMSTNCGHIFCDECIRLAISTQSACPTCRKRLTTRAIHPIFL